MQLGGHRTTTQARQSVSVSPPSPVLSSAVLLFAAGCKYSPHPSRFVKLSLSPVFSTRCALLLRSFALSKSSTALFSSNYELFGKNTGGAGAGCTCSPLRTGGTPSANSNSAFSIASTFRMNTYEKCACNTSRMNTYKFIGLKVPLE